MRCDGGSTFVLSMVVWLGALLFTPRTSYVYLVFFRYYPKVVGMFVHILHTGMYVCMCHVSRKSALTIKFERSSS